MLENAEGRSSEELSHEGKLRVMRREVQRVLSDFPDATVGSLSDEEFRAELYKRIMHSPVTMEFRKEDDFKSCFNEVVDDYFG